MGLRQHNPTTPGSRGRVSPDFSELSQGNKPVRALTEKLSHSGGRNNHGRITSRFRGGGVRGQRDFDAAIVGDGIGELGERGAAVGR